MLGRHTWRCKARITTADIAPDPGTLQVPDNSDSSAPAATADLTPREVIPSDICVCMCGKHCKGKRGLKAHQRSCATFKSVAEANYVQATDVEEVIGSVRSASSSSPDQATATTTNGPMHAKPGIKLPKTPSQWEEANLYFKTKFFLSDPVDNLDDFVENAQNIVYDYFADNYGSMSGSSDPELTSKYIHLTVNQLKKNLRSLKRNNGDLFEIKFVSALIRKRIKKINDPLIVTTEKELSTNFWSACRKIFNTARN